MPGQALSLVCVSSWRGSGPARPSSAPGRSGGICGAGGSQGRHALAGSGPGETSLGRGRARRGMSWPGPGQGRHLLGLGRARGGMPWPGAGEAASGCLARQVQSRRVTKLWNPAERALFHSTLLGVHVSDEFFGFVLVPHGEFRLSLLQPCTSVVFATPITNRSIQKLFPIGWCPVLAAGGAPGRSSRSALADLAIATPSLSSRGGRPREEKSSADGPEKAWVLRATMGPRGESSAAGPGVSQMWTSRRARLRGMCFPLRASPNPLLSVQEARSTSGYRALILLLGLSLACARVCAIAVRRRGPTLCVAGRLHVQVCPYVGVYVLSA